MESRPSIIERAFDLASSGRVQSVSEIRSALKLEGYSEDWHIQGPTLTKQLMKLIAKAKGS
jgi:hypothetical protein